MRGAIIAILAWGVASAAQAQSPSSIMVVTGEVNRENSERFTIALANRVDTIVGVQILVEPTEEGGDNNYLVDRLNEEGGVYISRTQPRMGGIQINAPTAYWRYGSFVIDGYFVVKYGGMGQGIMGYQLKPVDEAAVLLSGVRRDLVDADDIPVEEQAVLGE